MYWVAHRLKADGSKVALDSISETSSTAEGQLDVSYQMQLIAHDQYGNQCEHDSFVQYRLTDAEPDITVTEDGFGTTQMQLIGIDDDDISAIREFEPHEPRTSSNMVFRWNKRILVLQMNCVM
jgi:hypothetical protein